MRAPILPCHCVPSRSLDPDRPIQLSQNYGDGNPTVSSARSRFNFNLVLQSDLGVTGGTMSEIPSVPSHPFLVPNVNESEPVDLSSPIVDPTASSQNKSNLKSTVHASAGLFIDVLKESSDVCTPLKSVAGGLCAVLKYYDVRYPCSAKPFTPLTFESANGGKSWNDRIISTPGRRPGRITKHSCSRGRGQGDKEKAGAQRVIH